MKTIINLVVFFVALGFASAQQEEVVKPQAYQTQPMVTIAMEPGNTYQGICRQIGLEGNLPSSFPDAGKCNQHVAETLSGKTGEEAMKFAENLPVGTLVDFPFKTIEEVREIAASKAHLSESLKYRTQVADATSRAAKAEALARQLGAMNTALKGKLGDAEEKYKAIEASGKKATALEGLVVSLRKQIVAQVVERDTLKTKLGEFESRDHIVVSLSWFVGGVLVLLIIWGLRSLKNTRSTVPEPLVSAKIGDLEAEIVHLKGVLTSHDNGASKAVARVNELEIMLASMQDGAVVRVALPNEPDISSTFTVVGEMSCECGAKVKKDNVMRHLSKAHRSRDASSLQVVNAV